MKLIGLTGGVGMGKSTTAGFFLAQGARVVDTDDLARELVRPGQPSLPEIRAQFGNDVFLPDGSLDRPLLAQKVFADDALRRKLELILHPRIRACWTAMVETWRNEGVTQAVVVIPLLFETQTEGAFKKIICVACSPASQVERLAARGWSGEEIRRRIAAQMPVAEKMARSHHVVWTEGNPEVARQQIIKILKNL